MAILIVNVPKESDIESYLELVLQQIKEGYTSGYYDRKTSWEIKN